MLKAKRVYEKPDMEDGARVLVDRLWPRGISRDKAGIDLWMKDIAPSAGLRAWFGHRPERWGEFVRRYIRELEGNKELTEKLKEMAAASTVTLLFGAKDVEHNQAAALIKFLGDTRE